MEVLITLFAAILMAATFSSENERKQQKVNGLYASGRGKVVDRASRLHERGVCQTMGLIVGLLAFLLMTWVVIVGDNKGDAPLLWVADRAGLSRWWAVVLLPLSMVVVIAITRGLIVVTGSILKWITLPRKK